ncbi:zinc finger protein 70-like isoform X4 [Littorina saxatilis]
MLKMAPADLQHILDMFCIPVTLPFHAVSDTSTPSPAAASMTPSDISDTQTATVTPGDTQSDVFSSISRHHSNDQQMSPTERAINIVESYSKGLLGSGEGTVNSRELPLTSQSQTKTSSDLPEECFQVRKPELLHLEDNDCFRRGSDQHATELCVNTQGVKVDSNERDIIHPVIKSENDLCNGEMTTSVSDMTTSDSVSDLPVSFSVSDVPGTVSASGKTQSVVRKKCKKSGKSGSKQKYKLEKIGAQLSDVPLEEMIQTFPVAAANDEPGGSQSTSCNDSTPKKRFQCRACDKRFTLELEAYTHVTCHTGSPYLRCFRCGKKFNGISRNCNIAVLEAHLNQHDDVRPYVCEVCAKTYQSSRSFRQHMTKIHDYVRGAPPSQDRSLSCQQCSFHATSRSKLSAHNKEVSEEEQQEEVQPGQLLATSTPTKKSHLCNTCGKMYARKWALVEHERHYHKIGGGSRYTCPYCDKEFMAKYSFESHINGHEGKKPFSCSTCNKHFCNTLSLRRHRATCPRVQPTAVLQCEECEKSFTQRKYLMQHKQTHKTLTLFCSFCFKGFQHSSSLSRHKKGCCARPSH